VLLHESGLGEHLVRRRDRPGGRPARTPGHQRLSPGRTLITSTSRARWLRCRAMLSAPARGQGGPLRRYFAPWRAACSAICETATIADQPPPRRSLPCALAEWWWPGRSRIARLPISFAMPARRLRSSSAAGMRKSLSALRERAVVGRLISTICRELEQTTSTARNRLPFSLRSRGWRLHRRSRCPAT